MIERMISRAVRWANNWRLRRLEGLFAGPRVTLYGFPMITLHSGSTLEIGAGVVLCSQSKYTALALDHPLKLSTLRAGARISIGADAGISGGVIVAAQSISIGREVLLGANVTIVDTDFHPVAAMGRRHSDDQNRIGVAPVDIGDNVFIGAGAFILKGTKIGRDSVVGAGSVVCGAFPEKVIIAGNPAKVVGRVVD